MIAVCARGPRVFGTQQSRAVRYLCGRAERASSVHFLTHISVIGVSMTRGTLAGELPVPEGRSYATVAMECGSVLWFCGRLRYLRRNVCVGMSVYGGKKFIALELRHLNKTGLENGARMDTQEERWTKSSLSDCSDSHCRCPCQRGFVPAQCSTDVRVML